MHRLKAFLVGLLFTGSLVLLAPFRPVAARSRRGRPAGEGAVRSHDFRATPNADAAGWGEAEDDSVWPLTQLVTRLDPWMPGHEAVAARDTIRTLVGAIGTHPDYRHLARVGVGRCLIRGRLDPEHCYTYRPPGTDERLGLLVFLHGHGLNYLILLHALRPLCDELRMVLVSPTFGYGNWEAPGGVEAIDRARRFAMEAFPIDPVRTVLAGFSQGGAGVSRGGAALAKEFAGLVFVSPTMELDVIGSEAFADGWRGRPVLVIQGERDHNVKPRSVTAAVEVMQSNGAVVTYHTDADAGHFLFFAQLVEVRRRIAAWAKRLGAS